MGTESTVMLELAAEAFSSGNFELAAEMYGGQLRLSGEPESQREVALRRADALALGGRLAEAFQLYRRAARLERLRPAQLETLLDCLGGIRRTESAWGRARRKAAGCFACPLCLGILSEPVTLLCGHSFCKRCLHRERRLARCGECGDASRLSDVRGYRVNVVLSSLLAKCFPSRQLAVRLRHEGDALYAERRLEAALEKYDQAIRLAPGDHVLFSNRSLINSSLRNLQAALRDAEAACRLQPGWAKGHLRKAQALSGLRQPEEALSEYLFCIALEPDSKLARSGALKLLSELLAPLPDRVQEGIPNCSSLLAPRGGMKGGAFRASTPCTCCGLPHSCKNHKKGCPAELPSSPGGHGDGSGESVQPGSQHPAAPTQRLHQKHKRGSEEEEGVGRHEWPSKRQKSVGGLQDADAAPQASDLISEAGAVDVADLECPLCMRLFYEPVTTPCGHTFCLKCLERCLDHNSQCPLCKEDLSEYLARRQYCKTVLMEGLIAKYLPEELIDRQRANEEEMAELSNLNKNVPIFVCTMAFPTVPCPLHIFEPCYRLMIRRCMETGTKQFGMCLSDSLKGFADYGCILEIRSVDFFADGRSVVDTIGRRRFKVIQHRERDGYNTADIEYLEDRKVEGEAEAELRKLHDAVYDQALVWVNSLKPEQKDRIVGHFGPMPEKDSDLQGSPNGPSWCWWLLAVLPLEGRAQLPFLALTSLKERLTGIRRVLLFMSRDRSR
ncbi:LON peptidase N-terminal domain and RING finger protein 3-like [Brienomyrus brachyistius]|uniref:LON peptidase N-terminal domain and RING finger protein 3-like n=1 Tax=Brienomyrus brachyistius TaxID=42636 RepID=UPI0020B32162|nr:LON peptidase N-terminal domain and RING finger protein 3-like [Brienomyrus brachyistius]